MAAEAPPEEVITVLNVVSLHVDDAKDVTLPLPVEAVAVPSGSVVVPATTEEKVEPVSSLHEVELLADTGAAVSVSLLSLQDVELAISGAVPVSLSTQGVEDAATWEVPVSSQDVVAGCWVDSGWGAVVWLVSSVQVVSGDAREVVFRPGAGNVETVGASSEQLVELVSDPGVLMTDSRVDAAEVTAVVVLPPPGSQPLDGLVASHDWVDVAFGRGNGTEVAEISELDAATLVSDAVAVTSAGPVPVGPALATVELGRGNGAELKSVDDGLGGAVPKPEDERKPPVSRGPPVGARILEFDSGYGGLLVPLAEIPGAVPVPRTPELKGTEVPIIREDWDVDFPGTVQLVYGTGPELAGAPETPVPEPVTKLVGAVAPPVVGKLQLLELDQGKGGALVLDGAGPVPVPNPALPVGPAASEELLTGKGGDWLGAGEFPGVLCAPVPVGAVPVGPGPQDRLDELEKGNGAELGPVAEVETPVPVPIQEVPVGPTETVEELLSGNGAVPVALGNIPVEFPAEYGGDEVRAVKPELAELDIPVPVGRKPVEGKRVELDS